MDFISGYWQVEMSPEDQKKCAIITMQGFFQPIRMRQGLCNAPATFQQLMDCVLSNLKFSCVLVYLDDINVFSHTFTYHIDHLKEVFKRLLAVGLKLKPKKSSFFKEQIDYLGFIIDKTGLQPQPSK